MFFYSFYADFPMLFQNPSYLDSQINDNLLNIITTNGELTEDEMEYIIRESIKLKNATPRKIRIFYYQYLIFRNILIIRLEEERLYEAWMKKNQYVIFDYLVMFKNSKLNDSINIEKFNQEIGDEEIVNQIKYIAEMVTVL